MVVVVGGQVVLRLQRDGDAASSALMPTQTRVTAVVGERRTESGRTIEAQTRRAGEGGRPRVEGDEATSESRPGDSRTRPSTATTEAWSTRERSVTPHHDESPAAVSSSTSYSSSAPSVSVPSVSSFSMSSVEETSASRSSSATMQQTSQRESLLLLLPTEIQQHIYSFLPIAEIFATLPTVCRDIYQKTHRDDVFWHGIYDLHFGGPCEEDRVVRKIKMKKQQRLLDRKVQSDGDTMVHKSSAEITPEPQERSRDDKNKQGDNTVEDATDVGEVEELFWRKECARLMKELKDMEEVC